jgi:hypothetical protein
MPDRNPTAVNNFKSAQLCISIILNANNCFCADKREKLKIFTAFRQIDRLEPWQYSAFIIYEGENITSIETVTHCPPSSPISAH